MSWSFPWLWNSFNAIKDNLSDGWQFGDLIAGYAGFNRNSASAQLEGQANQLLGDSRAEYLADRAHTEAREDSSIDRLVEAYRRNGLNPALLSGSTSGLASSPSTVGQNVISNKLQVLGYILDLKNLDAKNRKITNDTISSVIRALK